MVSETGAPNWAGQPSDRRKLIAVVHADVVGYSRLIGLDDSGTLDRMRRLRREVVQPALAAHGGRIVNTAGDSLLMVFDSVDGATRFAASVQQQVPSHDGAPADRANRFRIGINVGDVIPGGTDVSKGYFLRGLAAAQRRGNTCERQSGSIRTTRRIAPLCLWWGSRGQSHRAGSGS